MVVNTTKMAGENGEAEVVEKLSSEMKMRVSLALRGI